MRTLDAALVARRGLRAYVYQLLVSGERERSRAFGHTRSAAQLAAAGRAALVAVCRDRGAARVLPRLAGSSRLSLEFDTDGVVIKVDDLSLRERLGTTAKFPRWAPGFQVSRAAEGDHAQGHPRQCRPHRGRHAVCRPRAGVPRGLHDLDGHAAQRRGHRAKRPARGRPRADREGRGRHSRRSSRPSGEHPARQRVVADADDLSRCVRAHLQRDEEEVVWRCANTSCPARLAPQPGALCVAVGDEHRGSRRVARRSTPRAWSRSRFCRPVPS